MIGKFTLKIFAFCLALAALFSLASCGGKENTSTGGKREETAPKIAEPGEKGTGSNPSAPTSGIELPIVKP